MYRPHDRIFSPSAPAGLVVGVSDFAAHLRVDSAEEYALLDGYIEAAVAAVEKRSQRLLGARTCVLRLPAMPSGCGIELPGGTVSAVASVVVDGVTVSSSAYTFFGDSPAQLVSTDGTWPVATGSGYPVAITYTAGYSVPAGQFYGAAVPAALRSAVLLIAAELFERRANAVGDRLSEVPVSADYLIQPYRIMAV